MAYDAVVLAGGAARRLGGLDKPAQLVGGATLLDRVLGAVAAAATVVAVGPWRATRRPVEWAREDPPGSGPIAALRAALPRVGAPWVAVLAADLPFLTADDVTTLRAAADPAAGALLVDDTGHDQYLAAVWRTDALRRVLATYDGTSMRGLVTMLAYARVSGQGGHTAVDAPPPWYDVDTQIDLERARGWV